MVLRFALVCLLLTLTNTQAQVLKVGAVEAIPYVDQKREQGIELDIIHAALPEFQLQISYMTYIRALMEVEKGNLDLMSPMSFANRDALYYSNIHVYYQPGVFSLKKRGYQIDHVDDLKNYSLATFQGAKGYFGETFAHAVSQSNFYTEIGELSKMIHLLKMERIDTVIFDASIFAHYWKAAGYAEEELANAGFFPLFPAHVVFYHESMRDKFNQGLAQIIEDGRYKKILLRYLSPTRVEKIMLRHQTDRSSAKSLLARP